MSSVAYGGCFVPLISKLSKRSTTKGQKGPQEGYEDPSNHLWFQTCLLGLEPKKEALVGRCRLMVPRGIRRKLFFDFIPKLFKMERGFLGFILFLDVRCVR